MTKIFISGITGFVGQNLNRYLENDFDIQGVSRSISKNFLAYDNLSSEVLNQCDVFVHLAGKAHDLKNVSKPEDYFEINTNLTISIFDTFLKSKCKKFIYMSSVKAVADNVNGILTEETKPEPLTPYGQSKLAAEEYLLNQKLKGGKKVYILRPCMIHGPGNKGNLNLLYSFVNRGVPYPLGKFENKRSFVSIDNLCYIIKQLINSKLDSRIFNIADDEALSTLELVNLISEVTNKRLIRIDVPKDIIKLIARIGDLLRLPINSHRLDKLTENYIVDNQKIKNSLCIKLPISTRDGLKKTIKSFQ